MPYVSNKDIPSVKDCTGYSYSREQARFPEGAPDILSHDTAGRTLGETPYKPIRDIFRGYFNSGKDRLGALGPEKRRAAQSIMACGTGALGYNSTLCPVCGKTEIRANSCGSGYCPCCKGAYQLKWIEARKSELIPGIPYFHVVFTIPSELEPLAERNPEKLYDILFESSAETLNQLSLQGEGELAAKAAEIERCAGLTPAPEDYFEMMAVEEQEALEASYRLSGQWDSLLTKDQLADLPAPEKKGPPAGKTARRSKTDRLFLGGQPGFIQVLHSWGAQMNRHSHLHVLLAGGALRSDESAFIQIEGGFVIPTGIMKAVFRGIFMRMLEEVLYAGGLEIPGQLKAIRDRKGWTALKRKFQKEKSFNVFIKETFNGNGNAVEYLARYVSRSCIGNSRIVSYTDTTVTFSYKDYKDGGTVKQMTLPTGEFIHRFLSHVLPSGFHRVRYGGFLSNSVRKKKLNKIASLTKRECHCRSVREISTAEVILKKYGKDIEECPSCGHRRRITYVFPGNATLIQVQKMTAQYLVTIRRTEESLHGSPGPGKSPGEGGKVNM